MRASKAAAPTTARRATLYRGSEEAHNTRRTTSARTGQRLWQWLPTTPVGPGDSPYMGSSAFAGNPRVYLYETGDNPYLGLLALGDHLLVTNDSVNMLSEAHATGKPVHILPLPGHHGTKPADFAERMITRGAARAFTLPLASWDYRVTDEMPRVTAAVRKLL